MKIGILAILLSAAAAGCFSQSQPNLNEQVTARQAQAQADMAPNCLHQISEIEKTYCSPPMAKPPVGMSQMVTNQRNSLAMNCKDPQSTQELTRLDDCVKELASRE